MSSMSILFKTYTVDLKIGMDRKFFLILSDLGDYKDGITSIDWHNLIILTPAICWADVTEVPYIRL